MESATFNPARFQSTKEHDRPGLADIVGATFAMAVSHDDGERQAIARTLAIYGSNAQGTLGNPSINLPASVTRSLLPSRAGNGIANGTINGAVTRTLGEHAVNRTMVGYNALAGGVGVFPGFGPDVLDRRRPTVSPASLVEWWPVDTRTYQFPSVQETSRANGSRYAGFNAQWGVEETSLPPVVDSAVGNINFTNRDLIVWTTVSEDIWKDARKLERWLNVIALSEIRWNLDYAIVQGVLAGPTGIITAPGTFTVAKGSTGSGAITSINIDAMWSSLYAGGRDNCIWLCNDDTFQKIDQLSTAPSAGASPETPYIGSSYVPAGRYGQPFPTLKGRPLIACEACPAIGTPGDLILWDPTDWIFTYIEPRTDIGPMSISVSVPPSATILASWESRTAR